MSRLVTKRYLLPFILITSLFFMWGFARAILDVLNKHFQEVLHISIGQSSLIQATTYLGYFLMALPAGVLITRLGYRKGVVTGLLLFALGALLFIPGGLTMSFGMFLVALFIIGCGLVILETAANPYAAELGDRATAASRLNLAQSFNGLGCILAPVIVGGFLFSTPESSVAVPYAIMGIAVLAVALVFTRVELPEINCSEEQDSEHEGLLTTIGCLWRSRRFRFGVITLFFYEIAEISINSLFINYATSDGWMDKTTASIVLSFGALGLFMLARIIGSWVMSKVASEKVLVACGLLTLAGALLVVIDSGWISRAGIFMCYAFEAIMFPTIFAITIVGAQGHNVKIASSFLMMTPIGGAIGTMLMGSMADMTSVSTAFIIPAIGYAFVLFYALSVVKNHSAEAPRPPKGGVRCWKLICIGHITLDKVITPRFTAHMPGGTAYYFAKALKNIDLTDFRLVTSLGESEMHEADSLRADGIDVEAIVSEKSVYFENKYGEDMNDRSQRVLAKADPFTKENLKNVEADIIHLGTLLADDFDLETIKYLSTKGTVSVDVQGYLRKVEGEKVVAVDYEDKIKALPYIGILKANEMEMETLTGTSDPYEAAKLLARWGVKEVVLTLGDKGSLIYADGEFHKIPAYPAKELVDATGCGDTYMAGYLYKRSRGASCDEAGAFAAAMCSIKLATKGPFSGTLADVEALLRQ